MTSPYSYPLGIRTGVGPVNLRSVHVAVVTERQLVTVHDDDGGGLDGA
ncbi:hypothetical protein ACFYNW_29660 [Streptomyces virginiae]